MEGQVEDEYFSENDIDINYKKHTQLVDDVLSLSKIQNLRKPIRSEPTLHISEFNLVKSVSGNKGSIHLNELTKVLKGRRKQEISKKVKSTTTKSKTLPTPLEKPQADCIKRSVNYEKSRFQLDRWEALVTSNRAAVQLVFPLDSVEKIKIEDKKSENFPSTWRLKSDLQKKLEKLEPQVEEYHIDTEKQDNFPLTLEEIQGRRQEAAKLRAHRNYKEAKARRQNKIKSKKYHRILRKEKIKQKLKEFEELQKTNPEEALKKLDEIEKARAEERFSLRHKGTGQWAKNKQIRAKYDKESRQALAQQLTISRELTKKHKSQDSESEDEGIGSEENSIPALIDESNPWVAGIKPDEDVINFVSGYRTYWDEHNKKLQGDKDEQIGKIQETVHDNTNIKTKIIIEVSKANKKKEKNNKGKSKNKEKLELKEKNKKPKLKVKIPLATCEWEVSDLLKEEEDIEILFDNLEDKLRQKAKQKLNKVKVKSGSVKKNSLKKKSIKKYNVDMTMPSKSKKHLIDEMMNEQPRSHDNGVDNRDNNLNALKTILEDVGKDQVTKNNKIANIDPEKFVQVKTTHPNSAVPDILVTDENEEENSQRDIILEAFEDDDIAEDFAKAKADEINKDTPKDIDLNLPGWGSWAGTGIKSSTRKRKRFIIKMPPKMPRRDDNKGSLIISEKAQAKIKPLMVSEIPFPFRTVKDYEASIRAPIGNTFVPETAFRKLIEPSVVTKMGAVIEPITKSVLVGTKNV